MDPLELTAAGFGFACVFLTVRQSLWCWPTGLVQVALYVAVFFEARLYSDVGLHVVYVALNVYGWWHWATGAGAAVLPVRAIGRREAVGWAAAVAAGTAGLGFATSTWTDADLPYWDAAVAATSLVAQYLLARKVLENWLLWVAADVLAVGVYSVKGLYPTAGLYAVFLVMAGTGYVVWRRTLPRPAPG